MGVKNPEEIPDFSTISVYFFIFYEFFSKKLCKSIEMCYSILSLL